MKGKLFSLFLIVTLFFSGFNPVFAKESGPNAKDKNSTENGDLPIVTEIFFVALSLRFNCII